MAVVDATSAKKIVARCRRVIAFLRCALRYDVAAARIVAFCARARRERVAGGTLSCGRYLCCLLPFILYRRQ